MTGFLLDLVLASLGGGMAACLLYCLSRRKGCPASFWTLKAAYIVLMLALLIPVRPSWEIAAVLPGDTVIALELPVSVGKSGDPGAQYVSTGTTGNVSADNSAKRGIAVNAADASAARSIDPKSSWTQLFCGLWLMGAAVVLCAETWRHIRFLRHLKRWGIADETLRDQYGVPVYRLNICRVPFCTGLFRRVLILPQDGEADDMILRHEMCHMQSNDLLLRAVCILTRSVHWFNPLMRYLTRGLNAVCEMAADEETTRRYDDMQRRKYAAVLIHSASAKNEINVPVVMLYSGGVDIMRRRIETVMSHQVKKRSIFVLILALVLPLCLPMCLAEQPGPSSVEWDGNIERPSLCGYSEPFPIEKYSVDEETMTAVYTDPYYGMVTRFARDGYVWHGTEGRLMVLFREGMACEAVYQVRFEYGYRQPDHEVVNAYLKAVYGELNSLYGEAEFTYYPSEYVAPDLAVWHNAAGEDRITVNCVRMDMYTQIETHLWLRERPEEKKDNGYKPREIPTVEDGLPVDLGGDRGTPSIYGIDAPFPIEAAPVTRDMHTVTGTHYDRSGITCYSYPGYALHGLGGMKTLFFEDGMAYEAGFRVRINYDTYAPDIVRIQTFLEKVHAEMCALYGDVPLTEYTGQNADDDLAIWSDAEERTAAAIHCLSNAHMLQIDISVILDR